MAAPGRPDFRVEVAWNSRVTNRFYWFEDVTPYFRSASVRPAGRNHELDDIEAGSADVVFDNSEGDLTPGKVPGMRPRNPLRMYSVFDDNHIHHECVNANSADLDRPRWWYADGVALTHEDVRAVYDSELGQDVFQFEGEPNHSESSYIFYASGHSWGSGHIQVPAGKTIVFTADIRAVSGADVGVNLWAVGVDAATAPPSYAFDYADAAAENLTEVGDGWVRVEAWIRAGADMYSWPEIGLYTSTGPGVIRVANVRATLLDGVPEDVYSDPDLYVVHGYSILSYMGVTLPPVAEVSGVYPTFSGYVEKWTQEYTGQLSTVTATCVDALALLSQPVGSNYRSAVRSWYDMNVDPDSGETFHYWPCVEEDGALSAAPNIGWHSLSVAVGSVAPESYGFSGQKTMEYNDGMSSGGFTVSNPGSTDHAIAAGLVLNANYRPTVAECATVLVDLWFRPEGLPGAEPFYLFASVDNAGVVVLSIRLNQNGSLTYTATAPDSATVSGSTSAGAVAIGQVHHIGMYALIYSGYIEISGYLNGAEVVYAFNSTTATSFSPLGNTVFGARYGYGGNIKRLGWGMRGTINHCVFAQNVSDGLHLAVNWDGADSPFDNEHTRISRMLYQAGWRRPWLIDPGKSNLLPARWDDGEDLMNILRDAARSAGGELIVNRAGEINYLNRDRRIAAPVRWEISEWRPGLRFELDDADVYNVVRAERVTGMVREVRDEESIAEYGAKGLRIERNVNDPNELQAAAEWALSRYRVPAPRCDALRIEAHALTGDNDGPLMMLAHAGTISDRIRLTGLPDTAPSTDLDFFIEGTRTEIAQDGGTLRFVAEISVSAAVNQVAWVLEDDVSGLLDSDYCVLVY